MQTLNDANAKARVESHYHRTAYVVFRSAKTGQHVAIPKSLYAGRTETILETYEPANWPHGTKR